MDQKLSKSLFEKYPNVYKLFRANAEYVKTQNESLKPLVKRLVWPEISCRDGWFKILDELSNKLEKLILEFPEEERDLFTAVQIKEKMGGLRFYLDRIPNGAREIINEATDASYKTCEVCGSSGKLRSNGLVVVTVCDKHFQEQEEEEENV